MIITTFLTIFYGVKFHRVSKEILNDKRLGFYTYSNYKGQAFVYIEELVKYDNNMSKVKIKNIEIIAQSYYRSDIKTSIKENFKSLMNSKDIEWLEVKQTLKDIRKEKLNQINKFSK